MNFSKVINTIERPGGSLHPSTVNVFCTPHPPKHREIISWQAWKGFSTAWKETSDVSVTWVSPQHNSTSTQPGPSTEGMRVRSQRATPCRLGSTVHKLAVPACSTVLHLGKCTGRGVAEIHRAPDSQALHPQLYCYNIWAYVPPRWRAWAGWEGFWGDSVCSLPLPPPAESSAIQQWKQTN